MRSSTLTRVHITWFFPPTSGASYWYEIVVSTARLATSLSKHTHWNFPANIREAAANGVILDQDLVATVSTVLDQPLPNR